MAQSHRNKSGNSCKTISNALGLGEKIDGEEMAHLQKIPPRVQCLIWDVTKVYVFCCPGGGV